MRRFILPRCFLLAAGWTALALPGLRAQVPGAGAADLSARGNAAFEAGNYKGAAELYDQLIQGYPSSEVANDARFRLAYADLFLAQYEPAAESLRKLVANPTIAPELAEQAAGLLPQVLSQEASARKPGDPRRQDGFEAAIKEYDNYLNKYPKAAGADDALYGRAVAEYQTARYADAARDLRANMASFPNGETFLDAEFLLSVTLATDANIALGQEERTAAQTAEAMGRFNESERLLGDIIKKRTDLALANDAQYQLGETLLVHAANSAGAAQDTLYKQALAAFRAVEPKEPMIAAQQARIAQFAAALKAERLKGAGSDPALARRLAAQQTRENAKLAALKAKDDPVLSARVKCGAVFFSLRRYDETRVLMRALGPSAKRPEDEKLVLAFTTLSYAAQNNVTKAVAAYDRFQAKYPGDPVGENLPFALANLFPNEPARAEKYLADLSKDYPKSRLRETAMLTQAQALAQQRRYDEAIRTLDAFLQSHPKRPYAAAAELARAAAWRDSGKLDDALAGFKTVRDTFKDQPQAEEAGFYVASVDLQKKDYAAAVAESRVFQTQFPESRLLPDALLVQAQAQQGGGDKAGALATLEDLSKRFPDTREGESSYFQRANLYIGERKFDDMARVFTQFVDKYPDSEQLFAAYDRIAGAQLQDKKPGEAAATYARFVERKPDSPDAPAALGKVAALWLSAARSMGNFISLGAPDQEKWKALVGKSIAASEQQLEKYPDAPATALGLENLLQGQQMLAAARVKKPEEVAQYFQALADRYKDHPAARSRVLFRLASITAQTDPAKALADMRAAYDPTVVYSPADIDQYGSALLAADPAAAMAVYEKLAADYPLPPNVPPAQAPPDIQEAQALALYGRAKVIERKDQAAAAQLYEQLVATYPRSSKVPEAKLGIAEWLLSQKKWDEALQRLNEVATAQNAPPAAKARALFLNGVAQEGKGEVGALDAYLKVAAFFATAPDAPEGLWKGGQLLERHAANLPDLNAKTTQLARARRAYDDLVKRYPASQFAAQAKERLATLPAPAATK